ncbi:acyl-CoA dehydrogenase family protein [Nocardia sp. alder85J]|uniref:acyl-CoA dehydrogenase family protein n=1 Tax=Nocardia sp. alder85J TaxID=2862949 RepID=UPI001CD59386|nr:acyl-CoA dehydrogenase family protein [Nocardia sp. alder85J]MCX4096830.1 acyl-CoA dehydrogenase family protein [Nocardia sp. alder85J]
MELSLGERADALRAVLRELLRQTSPQRRWSSFATDPDARAAVAETTRRLGEQRLLTLSWPAEYGGADGSEWEQTVLREEMWAHFEPRGAQYMGLNWVGPILMKVGTPEQKQRHLPAIAAGRESWCQGFSEPGSGSDLASLSLPATATGTGWRISGQKIWTSYAGLADYCFLAARTARTDNPRAGITIFLIPMTRPGVTVRPIDSMLGEQHLNEVFFDEVQAGPEDVLGEVDHGWTVMKLVLQHERIGIARYARDERVLATLAGHAALDSELARVQYARALVGARVARLLNYRAVALREQGALTDEVASTARIANIRLDQQVAELALDLSGPDALEPGETAAVADRIEDVFRYARSATIASGTIEVQRGLVARAAQRGERHGS